MIDTYHVNIKVGDQVKMNVEYLNPYTGTVTKVQMFDDGSPNEYRVRFESGKVTRFFAAELISVTEGEQEGDTNE